MGTALTSKASGVAHSMKVNCQNKSHSRHFLLWNENISNNFQAYLTETCVNDLEGFFREAIKFRVATRAQLLCRILQQWAMPTLGPSPKSKVGITHFQLLCQFMVGKVPKKWSRCQVEQVSCGSCKSMNPPPLQLPHQ